MAIIFADSKEKYSSRLCPPQYIVGVTAHGIHNVAVTPRMRRVSRNLTEGWDCPSVDCHASHEACEWNCI